MQVLDGGHENIPGESEESGGVGRTWLPALHFSCASWKREGGWGGRGRGEVVRVKGEGRGRGRLKQNLRAVGGEGGETGDKTK